MAHIPLTQRFFPATEMAGRIQERTCERKWGKFLVFNSATDAPELLSSLWQDEVLPLSLFLKEVRLNAEYNGPASVS